MLNQDYKKRLIDEKIEVYLEVFGAISIEGPKWCGKTFTSLNHAKSYTYMTLKENKDIALISPEYVLKTDYPQLIDEWQIVPEIWDTIRHQCDIDHIKGKFILTGSTTLKTKLDGEVFHTGTGRIAIMRMKTMSLFESGDSSGRVSISDMYEDKVLLGHHGEINLKHIAFLIIRGGWPENLFIKPENVSIIPESYIDSVLLKDINTYKNKKRDATTMKLLLQSLARNTASTVSINTIIKDVINVEAEENFNLCRQTVSDYMSALDDLCLTYNQEAFSLNYRSSTKIAKSPKRHLVDPSLACSLLNLTEEKLFKDLNTFGLVFESLVQRDLDVYMNFLNGKVYHFRDNQTGDEVDAILEFKDGEYAAVEIKLSTDKIEEAKKSLEKFYDSSIKKPKFMCIIVGNVQAIMRDKETGIYIVPITALKP